jgi:hypothetical protein
MWVKAVFHACACTICNTLLCWWNLDYWLFFLGFFFLWFFHFCWSFLANSTALSGLFEWSIFHLVADLDYCAIDAVINGENLVVQALVFNAVWIDSILPCGTSETKSSFRVHTVAVIIGSHAGGTVEQSSVSTFAAVFSRVAGALGSDGVTYLGTAESRRFNAVF